MSGQWLVVSCQLCLSRVPTAGVVTPRHGSKYHSIQLDRRPIADP